MAMSRVSRSRLGSSYRDWIRGGGFTDAEVDVVIDGTVVLLRRHCTQGTICCHCGNDDPDHLQVGISDFAIEPAYTS